MHDNHDEILGSRKTLIVYVFNSIDEKMSALSRINQMIKATGQLSTQ